MNDFFEPLMKLDELVAETLGRQAVASQLSRRAFSGDEIRKLLLRSFSIAPLWL